MTKSTNSTIIKRIKKKQKEWLEAFKKQWTISGTCLKIGIDRGTYYLWSKKYPDFIEKKKEIEREQIEYVETKLIKLIESENLGAIIFYLKNRDRQRWGAEERRRMEGAIKAEFQLNDEQFQQIIKYYRGKEKRGD